MASGDLIYEEQTGDIELTTQQVQLLRDVVDTMWDGQIANVLGVSFRRTATNDVIGSIRGQRTVTPADCPIGVRIIGKEP